MLVDIVIQPFYNKMPQVMALYDKLIKQMIDDVRIIIVNNGSTDGMRPTNFHKEDYIKFVTSNTKVNDSFLLTHALLRESRSEYVNILSYHSEIDTNYLKNLVTYLTETAKDDIILGGVESLKSRRSTIKIPDRRSKSNIKIPDHFFFENIILKRDKAFRAGLFNKRMRLLSNSTKLLCYNMIKSFNATYDVANTISVTLPNVPSDNVDRELNKAILDYDAYEYAFKNYVDNNVYKLARGPDKSKFYNAPLNRLIILPTKNNDRLEELISRQKAKGDKFYISNLPKYMSKRFGYIFQKHNEFDDTIIINENAPFQLPYFVDDFKIMSYYNEGTILTSDNDFSIEELRPSSVRPNMSISIPRTFVWEPGLNETMDWYDFTKLLATKQPDQKIYDLFHPPKQKAQIVNTSGDGGTLKAPAAKPHKESWYDWMED